MNDNNKIALLNDVKQGLLYTLRLNKLDKVSRTLQKAEVINSHGFLTIEGSQVFLDALWQAHPEIQKDISDNIIKIKKDEKNADK